MSLWINPDPSRPALAENMPIDTGNARTAALYAVCAVGLIVAVALVLP